MPLLKVAKLAKEHGKNVSFVMRRYISRKSRKAILEKWDNMTQGIRDALDALWNILEIEIYSTNNGQDRKLRNVLGMVRELPEKKAKQKGLSHALIGHEQNYILRLIIACHAAGINVRGYLYDGLLTDREIPQAIFDHVARETGLPLVMSHKVL